MNAFNGNVTLFTAKLLLKDNYVLSYWEDFMHHALAASCYFADAACLQASCIQKHATCADLRQLPLPGIAPKRAHGPKRIGGIDPGGLRGFLHFGLDVGVDFRGRGSQLSACHGSLPPECYLQQRAANTFRSPGVRTGLVSDRCRWKTASPSHRCSTKTGGERLPLCRIRVLRHTEARISLSPG